MINLNDISRILAFYIILAGCILSISSSFTYELTGAYSLSFGYLLLGITPYFLYGCFYDIFKNSPLIVLGSGILLLTGDLIGRFDFHVVNTDPTNLVPGMVLCTVLTLLVLPAGALTGKLATILSR